MVVLLGGAVASIALAIMKLVVGLRTNSVCIMLDSTNSFIDVLSGVLGATAFALLFSKKNANALYGYGRGEYVAGFLVSVLTLCQSVVFCYESLTRLTMPTPVWFSAKHCVIICVALVIKVAMSVAYSITERKVHSVTVRAICLDSYLDIGITATSIIVFAVSSKVNFTVDAIFGIVLSVVIFFFGIRMLLANYKLLLGRKATEEQKKAIADAAAQFGVEKIGKITLHDYGFDHTIGTAEAVIPVEELASAMEICRALEKELLLKTNMEITIVPMTPIVTNTKEGHHEE